MFAADNLYIFCSSGLETDLYQKQLSLTPGEEGPAIVTVVNSSRIIADIKRDLGRAAGQFYHGETGDLIVKLKCF